MSAVHQLTAFEDSGFVLMSRILGGDGEAIVQADVSSIAFSIWDITDPSSPSESSTGTLTVSTVVKDTLQTDSRWEADSTGYNFIWEVPATNIPDGAKTYRIEIKFTPTAGEPFHAVYDVKTINLYRS